MTVHGSGYDFSHSLEVFETFVQYWLLGRSGNWPVNVVQGDLPIRPQLFKRWIALSTG